MTCVIRSTRRTRSREVGLGSSRSGCCPRSCRSTTSASGSATTTATPRSTTRSSSPAAKTSFSTSKGPTGSGSRPIATRSPGVGLHERPIAPCRSHRTSSPITGMPPRRWSRRRLRWPPTAFFGQRLHAETRIELFKQATDTRPIELKNQGVRPRLLRRTLDHLHLRPLRGERSLLPALLAETTDEDPIAKLEAGIAPDLAELRLQRHGLSVEPSHLRHRRRVPHLRVGTACCRPARPSPTCCQRGLLLRLHPGPGASGSAGLDQAQLLGGGGEPTWPPGRGSTPASTGRASG